jgi:NAD(P)-dependent dehydrogenase (short-subunit alcohol dehydrogenase family)
VIYRRLVGADQKHASPISLFLWRHAATDKVFEYDNLAASAFDQATKPLGQITGVVNAAGVPNSARVEDLDFAGLTKFMTVNVVGLMYCCREATSLSCRRRCQAHSVQ